MVLAKHEHEKQKGKLSARGIGEECLRSEGKGGSRGTCPLRWSSCSHENGVSALSRGRRVKAEDSKPRQGHTKVFRQRDGGVSLSPLSPPLFHCFLARRVLGYLSGLEARGGHRTHSFRPEISCQTSVSLLAHTPFSRPFAGQRTLLFPSLAGSSSDAASSCRPCGRLLRAPWLNAGSRSRRRQLRCRCPSHRSSLRLHRCGRRYRYLCFFCIERSLANAALHLQPVSRSLRGSARMRARVSWFSKLDLCTYSS